MGRRCRTSVRLCELLPVSRMLASLVFGILYVARVGALDNGVARLPGMSSY